MAATVKRKGQGAELQRLMSPLERKKKVLELFEQIEDLMWSEEEHWETVPVFKLVNLLENQVYHLEKQIEMKTYIVKSYHDIFVDDYKEGEGKNVNSYTLSGEVRADTPKEAVNIYLNGNLGYNLGFENCEVCPAEKGLVQTSCLVDADSLQPSEQVVKMWENGEAILYANNIQIYVYELKEVTF